MSSSESSSCTVQNKNRPVEGGVTKSNVQSRGSPTDAQGYDLLFCLSNVLLWLLPRDDPASPRTSQRWICFTSCHHCNRISILCLQVKKLANFTDVSYSSLTVLRGLSNHDASRCDSLYEICPSWISSSDPIFWINAVIELLFVPAYKAHLLCVDAKDRLRSRLLITNGERTVVRLEPCS